MRLFIVILLVLLLLLQYRLWVGDGGLLTASRLTEEVEQQKVDNRNLQERNQTLEAEIRDLKQGLDAIEERARVDLGMIREGETFYQVIEEQPQR